MYVCSSKNVSWHFVFLDVDDVKFMKHFLNDARIMYSYYCFILYAVMPIISNFICRTWMTIELHIYIPQQQHGA